MVRTYQEVPKRARNSIQIQIGKLVSKYGEKEVRLVAMKIFEKANKQNKLKQEIAQAMKWLKEGKKICRPNWKPRTFWVLDVDESIAMYEKDRCFYHLAGNLNDKSLCEEISPGLFRNTCLKDYNFS